MSDQGYGGGPGWGPPAGPPGPPPGYPGSPSGYPGFPAGPPAPEGWGYGHPPPRSEHTNVMAVLGLVFAFVAWPAGLVLSAIGLSQTRRRNERGHGLALAGLIISIVAGVVAVVAVVVLITRGPAVSSSSGSAPAASVPDGSSGTGTVSCDWTVDTSGRSGLVDVGLPPDPVPTRGTGVLAMATNRGTLTVTLDRATAPCASASFGYLAEKGFFDGSPCHRQVDEPTFGVLQCGDPTGTGSGGPTYTYRQEVTPGTRYPRGTVAMANTGQPDSTSSQFFLCFVDTQLSPDYTAVGTVDEAGLKVLDTIAAAGDDSSLDPSPGGGKPNLPVTITKVTVLH